MLSQHRHLLPAQGTALDLACGLGANALLLAQAGLTTHAWDISATALTQLHQFAQQQQLTLHTLQRDIEAQPPAAGSFDIIVVSDFLFRPICAAIQAALKPGGLLFYTTWCAHKQSAQGPSNPDFLLQNNELLHLFSPMQIRFYQEDGLTGDLNQGDRNRAHLIAQAL